MRWVLGESRASELRGESMQDVIFNGTNTRKPASRASVELVFDNHTHRAGGQWNQFEEIAVKRVLTRDGTSSYYINNQPVRRRDVQDVFLGTGLGPRAYAIIGQGTISRIIESKPEELRLFLEEAAGVSKYKERRRETENRLSDTRENLTRVEDILRELNANLEKLERQAEVAQRFNQLQQQATLKQQQQWFLKREQAQAEQAAVHHQAELATNALESKTAELREIQASVENIRQAHYESGEQVNQAQGQLYQASAEVGRLEAEIRFVVEGKQRAQERLQQIQQQTQHWQEQSEQAQEQTLELEDKSAELTGRLFQLQTDVQDRQQRLPELELSWSEARKQVQQQADSVNQIQQQMKVLAAEQRGVQEQTRQLEQRLERLHTDRNALAAPDDNKLSQLQEQLDQANELSAHTQAQLDELEAMVDEIESARRQAQDTANQESAKLVELQARQQALKALQEKLRTDERLTPWLNKHGLQSLQPLWSKVHITPGWEQALEAALRERLAALEVSKLDSVKSFATDAPAAKLSFYATAVAASGQGNSSLPKLFDQLKLNDSNLNGVFSDWLTGCFTAKTVDEALAARTQLQHGQYIFTPQGHAVGLHSVSFYAQDSEQAGLLARAQEIENLDKQIRAQSLMAEEARLQLARAESSAAQSAQQRSQKRIEATQTQAQAHSLNVEFLRAQQLAEQVRTRQGQLSEEVDELQAQLAQLQQRAQSDVASFEGLDMQLAQAQDRLPEEAILQ